MFESNRFVGNPGDGDLPELMTVAEVAVWLKTTDKAIYAMVSRRQIPVVRLGKRVLFDRDELVDWIAEKRA